VQATTLAPPPPAVDVCGTADTPPLDTFLGDECRAVIDYLNGAVGAPVVTQVLALIQECTTNTSSVCGQAESLLASLVLIAKGCASGAAGVFGVSSSALEPGEDPGCSAAVATGEQAIQTLVVVASDCLAGRTVLCDRALTALADLMDSGQGCASATAGVLGLPRSVFESGTDPGCGPVVVTLVSTADQVLSLISGCLQASSAAAGVDLGGALSPAPDALNCGSTTTTVLDAVQTAANMARGCLTASAHELTDLELLNLGGWDPGCAAIVQTVSPLLQMVSSMATNCVDGAASAAAGSSYTPVGDPGCHALAATAIQDAAALVSLANGCLDAGASAVGHGELVGAGTDPGCAYVLDQGRQVADALTTLVNDCQSGTTAACETVGKIIDDGIESVTACLGVASDVPSTCAELVSTAVGVATLAVGLAEVAAGTVSCWTISQETCDMKDFYLLDQVPTLRTGEPEDPRHDSPPVLKGTVVNANGVPQVGARIEFIVEHPGDVAVLTHVHLGSEISDEAGAFMFDVGAHASSIPAEFVRNGWVNVMTHVIGDVRSEDGITGADVALIAQESTPVRISHGIEGGFTGPVYLDANGEQIDPADPLAGIRLVLHPTVTTDADYGPSVQTPDEDVQNTVDTDAVGIRQKPVIAGSNLGSDALFTVGNQNYSAAMLEPRETCPSNEYWHYDDSGYTDREFDPTVVGEIHAYYDAKGNFYFADGASSTIDYAVSYNSGKWEIGGSVQVVNNSGGDITLATDKGPKQGWQILVDDSYRIKWTRYSCGGNRYSYAYADVVVGTGEHMKTGKDVSGEDGPGGYGSAPDEYRGYVSPDNRIGVVKGHATRYSVAAKAFGIGLGGTTEHSSSAKQIIATGTKGYRHDVWGVNAYYKTAKRFYSW
jgi:hypothetical protein